MVLSQYYISGEKRWAAGRQGKGGAYKRVRAVSEGAHAQCSITGHATDGTSI